MRSVVNAITVLVALGLAMAGPAPTQEATEEALQLELDNLHVISTLAPRHAGAGTVLVIPSGQMKQEDLAAITEDMSVMARIFDKKLGKASMISISEFDYWSSTGNTPWRLFTSDKPATEAIYLADYGALFLMTVDFPLSAPPKVPQQKKTEEDADEVWAQTKKEIYTPQEVIRKTKKVPTPSQKYDAEKVESLKTTLLKALKHAANIRNLKPDDLLILTVNSQDRVTQSLVLPKIELQGLGRAVSARDTGEAYTSNAAGTGFCPSAALTIRAKKSDVDAYSKGDLHLDEFRKKVVMVIY